MFLLSLVKNLPQYPTPIKITDITNLNVPTAEIANKRPMHLSNDENRPPNHTFGVTSPQALPRSTPSNDPLDSHSRVQDAKISTPEIYVGKSFDKQSTARGPVPSTLDWVATEEPTDSPAPSSRRDHVSPTTVPMMGYEGSSDNSRLINLGSGSQKRRFQSLETSPEVSPMHPPKKRKGISANSLPEERSDVELSHSAPARISHPLVITKSATPAVRQGALYLCVSSKLTTSFF